MLTDCQGFMTVQLGLSEAHDRGVGLRHDTERRIGARRVQARRTPERRRAVRRRARLRSLLFTSLALVVPHQLKQAVTRRLRSLG